MTMSRVMQTPGCSMAGVIVAVALSACTPRTMERTVDMAGQNANRFVAHGNEPFWSIEGDGTRLLWKTPELPQGKILLARRVVHAMGTRFDGQDAGKAFSLTLFREPCNDGMSDRTYGFSATWTYDGREMHGCAVLP